MKIEDLTQSKAKSLQSFREQFAADVMLGLCSNPKRIEAKYLYNDRGSELFQKITQCEDYYVARTEVSILKQLGRALPKMLAGEAIDVIELGPGDGHKSELIIKPFLEEDFQVQYFPIDISEQALLYLKGTLGKLGTLHVHGIVAEYLDGLRYARRHSDNPQLVLFLGSNIGNLSPAQSKVFLRKLWSSLNDGDHVLTGFDLKKDIQVLSRAYNDRDGFTQAFNLNLLARINEELGGDFDLRTFEHYESYNPELGAMESHLISLKHQSVFIKELAMTFDFKAYEALHLEYSFKFLRSDIEDLATRTGFEVISHFADEKDYFVDSLWRVCKPRQTDS